MADEGIGLVNEEAVTLDSKAMTATGVLEGPFSVRGSKVFISTTRSPTSFRPFGARCLKVFYILISVIASMRLLVHGKLSVGSIV